MLQAGSRGCSADTRTVIDCFEKAVIPSLSEEEQRTNLHFIMVGGGPTGVEFAAELRDFVQEDLVKLYPMVKDLVKITVIQSGDHILNTFDERISTYAEQKFSRDGIEVQTSCQVVGVSDREINMNLKSTGEVCSVPHGLVVWSTGVGTIPVVRDLMDEIGQAKRRVLVTDEWLQVKGCENVYALGDCATIDQCKIMEDIATIFKALDKDDSGTLTLKEFQDVIDDILARYPQVELYLKSHHLSDVSDLLKDPEGRDRDEMDIEGFKLALSHVDSQMKSLPATTQLLLDKVHIFPNASIAGISVSKILKVLDVLGPVVIINSCHSGTNILGNLLLWERSRQLQNCPETGFPWVIAHSGFGILYTQGSVFAACCVPLICRVLTQVTLLKVDYLVIYSLAGVN
ncbi:hypothetical protein SLE2022_235490 [Rubroshorea leprosula]